MELNDMHNEHEHASTSLKIVLLIFAIILVGTLGFLVWDYSNTPDTTDYSAPSVKTTEKLVDCGDSKLYGFQMTFGTKWTGYQIKEVKPTDAVVTCYFEMPTTDTDTVWTTAATDHSAKFASVFALTVYTPAQYETAKAGANPPTELDKNDDYVWAYAPAQALPTDLQASKIADDVKNVVATFKLSSSLKSSSDS